MRLAEVWERIKNIIVDPKKYFKKKEKGVKPALSYYMILGAIPFVIFALVLIVISAVFRDVAELLPYGLAILAILYLLRIIFSFVIAGLYHLWITWVFKGKASYDKTYQILVYASTPSLIIGWIPYVNTLTFIYQIILAIMGTEIIHKVSKAKAIMIWVIPILALLAVAAIAYMIFLGTMLGAMA